MKQILLNFLVGLLTTSVILCFGGAFVFFCVNYVDAQSIWAKVIASGLVTICLIGLLGNIYGLGKDIMERNKE